MGACKLLSKFFCELVEIFALAPLVFITITVFYVGADIMLASMMAVFDLNSYEVIYSWFGRILLWTTLSINIIPFMMLVFHKDYYSHKIIERICLWRGKDENKVNNRLQAVGISVAIAIVLFIPVVIVLMIERLLLYALLG